MKGRAYRLLAGIAYPAVLGWVILCIITVLYASGDVNEENFITLLIILFFGFIYSSVPAILFSLAMEYFVNKHINHNVAITLLAGSYWLLFGYFLGGYFWQIGLLTGLVVGFHLRNHYNIANTAISENHTHLD